MEILKFYGALYMLYREKNVFRCCMGVLSGMYECHLGGIWGKYTGSLHLGLISGIYR